MQKALVIKELRETAGIVTLAVLGMAYVLAELTGHPFTRPWRSGWPQGIPWIPFLPNSITNGMAVVISIFAVALGLRQSAWELGQGTYHFLLHRPMDRRRIFATKLLVGAGLLLGTIGAAILFFALWAATPGTHSSPFYWSMTEQAWRLWFVMPLGYLGAFLSGIRPGRWYGSRLAPLAASIAIAALAYFIPWWQLGVLITLVAEALFVVSILGCADQRDY